MMKDRNLGVLTVIGQGYVGLPLAQAAAAAGWRVHGLDKSPRVVEGLNNGQSHIDDISDDEVSQLLRNGYRATTNESVLAESDVIVICVPTPLDRDGMPDLSFVEQASESIGKNLSSNKLIILESTTYPGTTERLVKPIIAQNSGDSEFSLAFSPERVDPGRKDYGISNTPKLVGGVTEVDTQRAVEFYGTFVNEVVPMAGAKEAETAKLLENTFRHVNIALVNEMAKFCHELDIDIWDVIRGAATKPFGFMKFTPGPGVGGHCIPIDPNYLSHEVRRTLGYPFRFVELAQEVNNSMPLYVVSRVQDALNADRKALNGSKVLLLGVTYKPNIADERESPAVPIGKALLERGAEVEFHDPLVKVWHGLGEAMSGVDDLDLALRRADAVVLLQSHDSYDADRIAESAATFLDTRGAASLRHHRL